ncbi:hypothetical protein ACKGJO_05460 [Gracilimonas sp. Q87]|uniref:hypothetical protein n=1 Tax=Gracilimonas sp. Q87 TaxID=3384766 RepID=UPI0039842D9A
MKYNLILPLLLVVTTNIAFGQSETDIQSENSNVERVFKTDVLNEIGTVYLSEVELFRPTLYAFDTDLNKLFVYDYGHRNLYSVFLEPLEESLKVLELNEVGNGVGSGPKEFRNPTDICITGDKVIVIDSDLARVTIWDVDSETLLSSFRPRKFVPFRIACNEEKIVLYNANPGKDSDFVVYDNEGKLISFLKDEEDSEKGPGMRMESGYLSMNDSIVVFTRTDVELMKAYDHEQMELAGKELYVSTNFTESKTDITRGKEQVVYKRSDEFLYRSRGVGVYNDYVIMLYSGRTDAYSKTLDFYKIDDLSYAFSVQLEHFTNTLRINGDMAVLRTYDTDRKENMLTFYKLTEF